MYCLNSWLVCKDDRREITVRHDGPAEPRLFPLARSALRARERMPSLIPYLISFSSYILEN